MIKKILLTCGAFVLFVGSVFAFLLAQHDFFVDPIIEELTIEPFDIAVSRHRGSYSDISETVQTFYDTMIHYDISIDEGIGIYFDNPETIPEQALRSMAGIIISPEEQAILQEKTSEYATFSFPQTKVLRVRFPLKSTLSFIIASYRGYPVLYKEVQRRLLDVSVPSFEVYNIPQKEISLFMPLENLDLFEAWWNQDTKTDNDTSVKSESKVP